MVKPRMWGFLVFDIVGITDLEKITTCRVAGCAILPAPAEPPGCFNVNYTLLRHPFLITFHQAGHVIAVCHSLHSVCMAVKDMPLQHGCLFRKAGLLGR